MEDAISKGPPPERTPVAMTEIWTREAQGMTVVCSDGAVFERNAERSRQWKELPPVPGTRRARELAAESPHA